MSEVIAIDLGAAFISMAYIDESGVPKLLKSQEGDETIPSLIHFSPDGSILVGNKAKDKIHEFPDLTLKNVREYLSDSEWFFLHNEIRFDAMHVMAFVFKYLKQEAETILKKPVTSVVITVPSYFGDVERTKILQAAQAANLQVLKLINEGTALISAYTWMTNTQNNSLLICHLSKDYFDLLFTDIVNQEATILYRTFDKNLGGDKYISLLKDYFCTEFFNEHGMIIGDSLPEHLELVDKAENTLKALSENHSAEISLLKKCDSNYDQDVQKAHKAILSLNHLQAAITAPEPVFDYYSFLGLTANETLDLQDINDTINFLKKERLDAAQNAPSNAEKYRAADDLLILANATRSFANESSRITYDKALETFRNSLKAKFLSEESLNAKSVAQLFDECLDAFHPLTDALAFCNISTNLTEVFASDGKQIYEYFSPQIKKTKLKVSRERLFSLFNSMLKGMHGSFDAALNSADRSSNSIDKILFYGEMPQISFLKKEICGEISKDSEVEFVSQNLVAIGAIIQAGFFKKIGEM